MSPQISTGGSGISNGANNRVQNTLKVRVTGMATKPTDNRRRGRAPVLDSPEQPQEASAPSLRASPANENDRTTAQMLARLRKQPSMAVYYFATGISALWFVGWVMAYGAQISAELSGTTGASPILLQGAAVLVMPIIAIFAIAYFNWRAQQLRQVSEVLMHSALRLIHPQNLATEGLTSIAQAVRQEVDLLVGGVEHAFQRATALEEIVHKEISAVERAFGGNEDRIRGLVNGLETQRIALQQTSALVSNDAGPMLNRLESNTQNLGQVINLALSTFTRLEDGLKGSTSELARTIEEVAARAAMTGQEIGGHSQQFERMSTTLVNDFRGFSNQLQQYVETLNFTANNLGNETRKFGGEVKGMETSLLTLLKESASQLTAANMEVGQTIERLSTGTVANAKQSAAELAETFGSIEQNITYHLKSTSNEIASLIERSGVDTASRIDASSGLVTHGLQTLANDFIQKVQATRTDLLNVVGDSGNQVAQAVDVAATRFNERINQSGSQMLAGLDQSGNQLLAQLATSGTSYATRIDEIGGRLSAQLDQNVNRASTNLEEASARVTSQLDRHTNHLTVSFDEASGRLTSLVDQSAGTLTNALDAVSGKLTSQLEHHTSKLATTIQQTAENHGQVLANTAQNFTMGMDGSLNQALVGLSETSTRIDASATTISNSLNNASNLVTGQMQAVGANVNDLLVATSGTIAAHLKETSEIVGRQMQDSGLALSQNIETSGGMVTDRLINASGDFLSKVNLTRDNMLNALLNVSGEMTGKLETTSSQIFSQINSASGKITHQLNETSKFIADHIVERTSEVSTKLQDSTVDLYTQLDEISGRINNQLNETGKSVTDQISGTTSQLTTRLQNASVEMNGQLAEVAERIAAELNETSTAAAQHINNTAEQLSGKLNGSTSFMFTSIDKASSHITDQLENMSLKVADHIINQAADVTDRVTIVTEKLTNKLDGSSTQLGALLTTTESRMGNQLEQATTELAALFDVNTRMMTEQLEQSSTAVTSTFASTAVRAAQALNQSSQDVTSKIEDASQAMFGKLEGTTRELGQRFDVATDHLERVTGDMSSRLDGTGKRFAEILADASGQIFSDLGKARDAFHEGLGETTMQISGRFEQETGLLVGRIDRAVQEFDGAANSSSGKLDEAGKKFAKHVETANTYLADQLAAAALDVDTRLESVSMKLTGKLEMTGSRISERLDDVSALVEKSIDKFNNEMEQMLQSRKDSLDMLVSDANRRASEVDGVMTSYINLIEESLTTAESRAQNINRIVSDQTAAALSRLEEELRKLETNSNGQAQQAARVLRDQHERALASMNEMLSSTASDFQQTAQDMRITAQQVVKDIDAARGELKRAVIDMPEETRVNADNMRRVVADQISALNALAEVVRKQSGSLDYSGPGYITPRSSGGPNSGKSEGASFEAPIVGTMSAIKAQVERQVERVASPTRVVEQVAPARRLTDTPPARQTQSNGALAKEVDAFTQKLHVSARDLVEAIEGSLPRDLEKRFAGSDKSVYTQRLYESRSRKLVKAIEGRYSDERLLRGRVQAYNRLFEKLLDTLSESKGGESVMEQVLASEQGRIYVMLAEAAGRMPSQS
jgi:ribosome-associated translation inhibitor RaiA